jgi:hypothetical protein
MYDTINSWINRVEAGDLSASTRCLTNAKEIVSKDTGEVWTTGQLENMKVTVSMAGVSIKGSLSKFLLPDNTYTLNRHQAKEAIEKLSDLLHLPLEFARITRIDISANMIIQYEALKYYEILGACPYFNRVQQTLNTLYYHGGNRDLQRTMVFYNKAREVSDRNGIIPDVFTDENLLRYESRWITRLPRQLKENEVMGRTLYDERFYSKVIDLWADNYFRIEKKRIINMDAMDNFKKVSDAIDFVFAIALQKMPVDEVQVLLEEMKRRKVFADAKYYSRLKKKLKDISGKADMTDANALQRELDNEIRNILTYKR